MLINFFWYSEGSNPVCFLNTVILNFEEQPEFADCFINNNPKEIVDRISILTNSSIRPHEIEFVLRSEEFRMPVGRVQSVFMYPMFFNEFLLVLNEKRLIEYLETIELKTGIEPVFSKSSNIFFVYIC